MNIPCLESGCGDKHYARGYCRKHYRRFMRNGLLECSKKCVIPNCPWFTVDAGDYCRSHEYSLRKYGDPLIIKRNRKKK